MESLVKSLLDTTKDRGQHKVMYLFVDTRNRTPLHAPSFCTLQSVGVAINTRVREVRRSAPAGALQLPFRGLSAQR